nr:AMP-binding protein [Gordonia sp. NB41Y]EMP10394.2 peptide synthetase [Gordonia sp. NB41Y]
MTNAETLTGRFAATVGAHAVRTALRVGERVLTYAQLAREIADRTPVLTRDLPADRPVPVVADGSPDAVLDLLTILFSTHPLVAIDASSPRSRVAVIREQAEALTLPGCALLAFTSGSTGAPKAVRQGHALWLNQADELAAELGIVPGTAVAQALPIAFGGGLDITVTTLLAGGELHLIDARLDGVADTVATLTRWHADSVHLSPALLRPLLAESGAEAALAAVRLVATCGEALDAADLARLRAVAPHVTFVNRSGSSETGNLAFGVYPPQRPLPEGTVPAGKLAAGKQFRILDDDGSELGPGATGIIELTSPYLSLGYVVDGRCTDFPEVSPGVRRHRLGDRGRIVDGELHLAGRVDDTVKIRGYRVDIGTVTAAARAVPGIGEAVVVARTDLDRTAQDGTPGGTALVAYLAPPAGDSPPSLATVRTTMAAALPAFMVPTHTVLLSALPRNARGKIDRAALPLPPRRPHHVPPRTTTERLLAPMWADLLGVDEVGTDDDLVALGADSLTMVTLLRRVEDAFGVTLPASAPVTHPTLAAMATAIDAAGPERTGGDIVELGEGHTDTRPIVFAFGGAGESALAFAPLARRLSGFRVIGLHAHGLETRGIPDWTVTAAARRGVRHIRAIAPHGPYRLIGHSLGGVIATEAARILTADGETVEHVVYLDTVLSGPLQRRSGHLFTSVDPAEQAPAQPDSVADPDAAGADAGDLWRTRLHLLTAGWWPRPAQQQWSLFHELGRRTAMLHRLRPWAGPATVVLAQDNPDPHEWWDTVAPAHHGIHTVPGDHNGMLRAPHVDHTAAVVTDALTGVRT